MARQADSFAFDLDKYGPSSTRSVSREEAKDYCARVTATHYENFSVVTWLTPHSLRPAFQAVYAFCRWADDLGDEVGDPAQSLRLLAWWRGELQSLYKGQTRHPVFIALAEIVRAYDIPIAPFDALISAFEQDQRITEYDTYEQLLDYCVRSANPVGHLVLYLARSFTAENAALADCTCTALQLANFWQDVARDLKIGRIYLPRADRERFGVAEADIRNLRFTPAFAWLLALQVDRARALLYRGWPLVERMPRALAIDVDLFTSGGLAILERIESMGYDVLSKRPALTRWKKTRLLIRALAGRFGFARPSPRQMHDLASRVEATAHTPATTSSPCGRGS
jgi:squalene synthase HpnC